MINKIKNHELQLLVSENSDKKISILIEVDLPQPQLMFSPIKKGVLASNRHIGVVSQINENSIEEKVHVAQQFLETILETSPRWFRTAHSFVAMVTPEQIRTIVMHPLIKAIWLNNKLSIR